MFIDFHNMPWCSGRGGRRFKSCPPTSYTPRALISRIYLKRHKRHDRNAVIDSTSIGVDGETIASDRQTTTHGHC
jgi:hypothetical protein